MWIHRCVGEDLDYSTVTAEVKGQFPASAVREVC